MQISGIELKSSHRPNKDLILYGGGGAKIKNKNLFDI